MFIRVRSWVGVVYRDVEEGHRKNSAGQEPDVGESVEEQGRPDCGGTSKLVGPEVQRPMAQNRCPEDAG